MRNIVLIVFAIFVAGCQKSPDTDPAQVSAEAAAESASAEIGSWGVDLETRALTTQPGDDFFRYASGTWLDEYELPADKTSFGAFHALRDLAQERVRDLVTELAAAQPEQGSIARKIGDYYNSYLDTSAINARGIEPIQAGLDAIAAIDDITALTRMFGRSELIGTRSPISFGIEIDRQDPDRFIAGVSHSGLGLPDRDYYLEDSERFVTIRGKYVTHIGRMLELVGFAGGDEAAGNVMALETAIAQVQWPRADRRNRDLTYNLQSIEAISAEYSRFAWQDFLDAVGASITELNIRHPSAIAALIPIVNETPVETWRAYLTFHLVTGNAGNLAHEVDDANFDFYGRTLRGQPEQRERWRRAISLVGGGESLG
ncbi:MAG: M13 family metallopeptidase N-terminal domain-containing protein, partial [Gammaproteobacteria bacterium]|nr:M13 family metallopeptidase N-terminal domain-containing protein [Gammaproteobacteria bacterium]